MRGPDNVIVPGNLVAVSVPRTNDTLMLQKYNGKIYKVKGMVLFKKIAMYSLIGCVSDAGKDYWFAKEWLRKVTCD